ncbi:MAG TPA: glutamine-hydrolyzing GMP synthase [Sulfolobales archaeon]|nr:glutamine-hydrolyzing GMP synthase [Sulfolobales archaeon]
MAEENRDYDSVLIVDFGGQYTHLIARRIRELGVYSEIIPARDLSREVFERISPRAVILSGSPASVLEQEPLMPPKWILDTGIPILGICYGHQALASMLGGRVSRGVGEYGGARIRVVRRDAIFEGFGEVEEVWMSHSDYVEKPPNDAEILAVSEDTGYIASYRISGKPIYGVQFHPEVSHTVKGRLLLDNFLRLAGTRRGWRPSGTVDRIVNEISRSVGPGEKVLCAVSGGIDSTVAALLVKRAVGDRLVAVFVDHGLLREGEAQEVLDRLRKLGLNPVFIDASKRFLEALKGVRNPEEKRRIIGKLFADIFREIVHRDPDIKWLAQGTTYPDVIESGSSPHAARIKTHHNVGGLPRDLGLKVIEPLRSFYKDEVRELARVLGVPEEMIKRHPFPGPGLAVRIVGEVSEEKLRILRRATKIVEEELKIAGIYDGLWQAFPVLLESSWVGVKGDARREGYIVIIRAVESEDGMTAEWARIPHEVLDRISKRITRELPEVTMVAYAITSKPPSTIEPQ